MQNLIEPKVLKGFRDYLPAPEIARRSLLESLETVFRSFGFVPIDTPCLEYAQILLGKGGGETDKQVYRFKDKGDRDVALRFDLTVPFARFMAEHVDELYLPFRRYHMAKVWRGENTQRGRYREFMQCDFDIVGSDSPAADADIVLLIHAALSRLSVGAFKIRVNHRLLFNRFLEREGLREKSTAVLRIVDKLDKIGADQTRSLLGSEIGEAGAAKVLDFIKSDGDFENCLSRLEAMAGGPGPDSLRLRSVWAQARGAGADGCLVLEPSITRGLDYYTGIVFETILVDMPEFGSVCGGGRYDELASLYTTRQLPGVGASIGLDRLLAALESSGKPGGRGGYASILILNLEEELAPRYQEIAAAFRRAGLGAELYAERKKIGQQFSYAEKKSIPFALVLGHEQRERGVMGLKNIASRESQELSSLDALIAKVAAAQDEGLGADRQARPHD